MIFSDEQIERSKQELEHAGIESLLKLPSDFGTIDDRIGIDFALGPVVLHRDSDLLSRANHAALIRDLEELVDSKTINEDDYYITTASHWAVGWVEHISYKVLGDDGRPSYIAAWVGCWLSALADYPIADEMLYSEMEFSAKLDSIWDSLVFYYGEDGWDVAGEVYDWLSEHNLIDFDPDIESVSESDVIEAYESLGYAKKEEEE